MDPDDPDPTRRLPGGGEGGLSGLPLSEGPEDPPGTAFLELAAGPGSLASILAFVDDTCARAGIVGSIRHDLRLAVEEVCTNILQHAYGGRPGPLRIDFRESGSRYLVTIEDQAEPFDPSSAPAADLSSGWEERRPGGQGWHLVKNVVEEVRYERTAAPGNRLILVKTKPPGGGRT